MGFTPSSFSNALPGDQFLDFFLRMLLVFGLSFELPLLLIGLNVIGALSAQRLRGWWRSVVFAIFAFSAVAVPTGDPLTMCVLALPLTGLFLIALGVMTLHDRSKGKRLSRDAEAQLSPDEASRLD